MNKSSNSSSVEITAAVEVVVIMAMNWEISAWPIDD